MIELSLWLACVGVTLLIVSDVMGIREQHRGQQ